jgi:hypothetical protein
MGKSSSAGTVKKLVAASIVSSMIALKLILLVNPGNFQEKSEEEASSCFGR